ncbi:hypothetical protein C8R46DRAFT_1262820 [Mycena filopes]|nr:hypothetical protein C8R46DRAFT_1262820 [Mycena filopes]
MSQPPSGPPAFAPDVSLLFGPMLLGVILNTLLFGVMLVQAAMYYQRYKGDRTWFRYLVLYLVVAETANWVCDIGLIYEPLILRYGTPRALEFSPVMLRTDGVLTVLVSTPIQLFIAWRIHVVTRSLILPAIVSLLALVSLGGGIATTTVVSLHPKLASFPTFRLEIIVWLVSSAACDVFLTVSLVYSLWIRKTHIKSTDSYVNKVIRLTVQTGTVTAAGALLDMLFTFFLPNSTISFIIDFPLSKLYTNSLISTLNARAWKESTSKHDAPNALFEQTPIMSRTSFVLTTTSTARARTTSHAHSPNAAKQDSMWREMDNHV